MITHSCEGSVARNFGRNLRSILGKREVELLKKRPKLLEKTEISKEFDFLKCTRVVWDKKKRGQFASGTSLILQG